MLDRGSMTSISERRNTDQRYLLPGSMFRRWGNRRQPTPAPAGPAPAGPVPGGPQQRSKLRLFRPPRWATFMSAFSQAVDVARRFDYLRRRAKPPGGHPDAPIHGCTTMVCEHLGGPTNVLMSRRRGRRPVVGRGTELKGQVGIRMQGSPIRDLSEGRENA